MAGDPINEALADVLPGLTEAWVDRKFRRQQEEQRNRAASLIGALQEQDTAREAGNITPSEFERQAIERGIIKPEERVTDPTLEGLTPDKAEVEMLREMGPGPTFTQFAGQLQAMRESRALQSLTPFVAKSIGVDEAQVRAGGTEGLKMAVDLLKALPSSGGVSYQAIKVTNPDGTARWATLNKNTGEITETDAGAITGSGQPVLDMNFTPEGQVESFFYGPEGAKKGPAAAQLDRLRAKRVAGFERQRTSVKNIVDSIGRVQQLVAEGQPRGKVGRGFQQLESATNQLAAAARSIARVPKISEIQMPDAIEAAAVNNARIRTIAYNLALALARFHEPESGDISARSVERELDAISPAIGGSDAQTIAALGEVSNSVLRELANEANALGLEFDISVPGGMPQGFSTEAEEGANLLEEETGLPVFPTEVPVDPSALPTFNPKSGPTRLRFNMETGEFEPVPPNELEQHRQRGLEKTRIGGGQ